MFYAWLIRMKSEHQNYDLQTIDCIEGMRTLGDGSVDLVVTSPPYNLGIKYRKYDDNKSRDEYLRWSCKWAKEVKRVLKEKGSFFLNLGSCPSNPSRCRPKLASSYRSDITSLFTRIVLSTTVTNTFFI